MAMEADSTFWSFDKPMNIMILGKTGAGKSTLINAMLNTDIVTGVGERITDEIKKITVPETPITIYDTPGLELTGDFDTDERYKETIDKIVELLRTDNPADAIHCIWYCVNTSTSRFESGEQEFVEKLINKTTKLFDKKTQYHVPIVLVMTQSFSKNKTKELREYIEGLNLDVRGIIPVLAQRYVIDDEYCVKEFGMDRLAEVTSQLLPEAQKNTWCAHQKQALKLKCRKAHCAVAVAAAATFGEGFIPVPVGDAVLMIPTEVKMLKSITQVFGLFVKESTWSAIVSWVYGVMSATIVGKITAAGILKLVPGIGIIAGGAISGGVGAAVTASLGEAYIDFLVMVSKSEMSLSDLETEEGKAKLTEMFKQRYKLKRNKKGEVVDEKDS